MNVKERILLFLLLCIPIRLFLAFLGYRLKDVKLRIFGIVMLVIGFSFLYLFLAKKRLDAQEGGGKTWWSKYRIVHSIFYIIAGVLAIKNINYCWIPLVLDVIFGMTIFIIQHYKNGDFKNSF
jgi:hypothetical protein